jgi:hypothetical protein
LKAFILSVLILCAVTPTLGAQSNSIVKPSKKHKLTDTVGVVNSEVITLYDFRNQLSAMIEEAAGMDSIKGGKVTPEQFTRFVNRTWNDFITDVIIEHEIEKRKLTLSVSEINELLFKDPPQNLRKNFTDSLGAFHQEYLVRLLTDPSYDSIATQVRDTERLRLETARLIKSVSHEKDQGAHPAFDAWLKQQRKHSKVTDNRTAFGYY